MSIAVCASAWYVLTSFWRFVVASCGSLPVALTVFGSALTTLSVTSKCMTSCALSADLYLATAAFSSAVMFGHVGTITSAVEEGS